MRSLTLAAAFGLTAAAAVSTATPAEATGKVKCQAGPQSGWKNVEALKAQLTKDGWKVTKAKVDGGCYEVYGVLPTGEKVEAYFHPVSFEKLYVAQRGKCCSASPGTDCGDIAQSHF
ncbi:MAG: PepSY domain-containing protein [Novosphingobium sp.]